MDDFVSSAIDACREIHTQLIENPVRSLFVSHDKGHGGDVSSGFDLSAEAICFRHLHPYGAVFSEESGWMSPSGSVNIIIDPIDGSDNFASGFPYYGVAIARECNGITTEGIVCNLANGEIFVRTSDEYYRTSLFNPTKHSIQTNPNAKIGLFEKASEHPDLVRKLIEKKLKFRSPGALALSLAYAPYVKYVLFLGTMRPYDIQAGLFLSRHLYTFQNDSYLLVCKDQELFEEIRLTVEKECF